MKVKQYGLLILFFSPLFAHSSTEVKLSWFGVVPPISSNLEKSVEINPRNIQIVEKENSQLIIDKIISKSFSNNKVQYIVYTVNI
ncbi:TPA: hypothetical protein ACX6O7_003759 [Photobacterium damselae]